MKIRHRKCRLYQFFLNTASPRRGRHYKLAELLVGTDHFEMTDEDRAWLNITPVGREFGSPDFERLSAIDDWNLEANRDQITKQ
jgi:hypothetical protein